jgi:hypothetical protein
MGRVLAASQGPRRCNPFIDKRKKEVEGTEVEKIKYGGE